MLSSVEVNTMTEESWDMEEVEPAEKAKVIVCNPNN